MIWEVIQFKNILKNNNKKKSNMMLQLQLCYNLNKNLNQQRTKMLSYIFQTLFTSTCRSTRIDC